jgi:hypothetical protein
MLKLSKLLADLKLVGIEQNGILNWVRGLIPKMQRRSLSLEAVMRLKDDIFEHSMQDGLQAAMQAIKDVFPLF